MWISLVYNWANQRTAKCQQDIFALLLSTQRRCDSSVDFDGKTRVEYSIDENRVCVVWEIYRITCSTVSPMTNNRNWTKEEKRRMWPFLKRDIHRSDETDQHKQIGSFFEQGLLGVVPLQSRSSLLVWHSHIFLVNCRITKHLENENIENMQLLNRPPRPCNRK